MRIRTAVKVATAKRRKSACGLYGHSDCRSGCPLSDVKQRSAPSGPPALARRSLCQPMRPSTTGTIWPARRAIHCAQAITEAMAPLGIQVRAGLHTGEVERTEADVVGIAIPLAARIMDTASAGEVVIRAGPSFPSPAAVRLLAHRAWH